jgi:hypothetical protein
MYIIQCDSIYNLILNMAKYIYIVVIISYLKKKLNELSCTCIDLYHPAKESVGSPRIK